MSRQTAWLAALFHLTSSSAASARRAAYLRMVFELIAFTAVWQVEQRREVPVAKPNLKAQSHRLPVRIGESSDQPDLALGKSDRKQRKRGRRSQPRLLPITQCTVGGSQEFWLRARPERLLRRRLRASTGFPLRSSKRCTAAAVASARSSSVQASDHSIARPPAMPAS